MPGCATVQVFTDSGGMAVELNCGKDDPAFTPDRRQRFLSPLPTTVDGQKGNSHSSAAATQRTIKTRTAPAMNTIIIRLMIWRLTAPNENAQRCAAKGLGLKPRCYRRIRWSQVRRRHRIFRSTHNIESLS